MTKVDKVGKVTHVFGISGGGTLRGTRLGLSVGGMVDLVMYFDVPLLPREREAKHRGQDGRKQSIFVGSFYFHDRVGV